MRVWDKRDLARPLHVLTVHVKPTMRMEWSPTHAGRGPGCFLFMSTLEDHALLRCLVDELTLCN